MVRLDGVDYFVDERLREFREVARPWARTEFGSAKGRQMLREFVVDECPECGLEIGITATPEKDPDKCRRCGVRLAL